MTSRRGPTVQRPARPKGRVGFSTRGPGGITHVIRDATAVFVRPEVWHIFSRHSWVTVRWECGSQTTHWALLEDGPVTCDRCRWAVLRKMAIDPMRRPAYALARYTGYVGGVVADDLRRSL